MSRNGSEVRPGLSREDDCVHAISEMKLGEDRVDVRFDGAFCEVQFGADFFVRVSSADLDEYVGLSWGEVCESDRVFTVGWCVVVRTVVGDVVVDEFRGEAWVYDCGSCRDGSHGVDQGFRFCGFQKEGAGACPQASERVLVEVEGSEDDGLGVRETPSDDLRGLDAAHSRHADVHDYDVRLSFDQDRDGFFAGCCFRDHRDVVGRVQDERDARAFEFLVVYNRDRQRLSRSRLSATHRGLGFVSGSTVRVSQPPPSRGPASWVPPSAVARSAIALSPAPAPRLCAGGPGRPSSVTVMVTVSLSPVMRTATSPGLSA